MHLKCTSNKEAPESSEKSSHIFLQSPIRSLKKLCRIEDGGKVQSHLCKLLLSISTCFYPTDLSQNQKYCSIGKTGWQHFYVWILRNIGGWSSGLGSEGQQGDADPFTEIHTGSFVHRASLISGAPHIYSFWTHITPWIQILPAASDWFPNVHPISFDSSPSPRVFFTCLSLIYFFFSSRQLHSATNSTRLFECLW